MVKQVYVKALVITAVLFAGNFFIVKYLDDSRAEQLRSELYSIQERMQSSRVLLLYSQYSNDSAALCPMLENQTRQQMLDLYALYGDLEKAREANVFTDVPTIQRRFILTNAELLLYLRQFERQCGRTLVKPVLYFYPEGEDCLECRAQARVLDALTQDCPSVRVFAFPTNSDLPVVQAIVASYGVDREPSLAINEKLYPGVSTREQIVALTGC